MKALRAYFRTLFADLLYWRVCVALWGLPFVGLACFALAYWRPTETLEWFGLVLLVAGGIYGAWLVYMSLLGNDENFDRATRYLEDGGELFALVLIVSVAVLAIPLTIIARSIKRRRSGK